MTPTAIGFVGGIASGKSTVTRIFAQETSATVIDADRIARRVMSRAAVRRRVLERFPGARTAGGAVDRRKLARLAFRSARGTRDLEALTHPPIRTAILRSIRGARRPVVLLDAPLLLETGLDELCDAVVYVECPARERRRRAAAERGWSAEEHRSREARQWSVRRKRARADYVVRSRGPEAEVRRQVRSILRRLEKGTHRRGR